VALLVRLDFLENKLTDNPFTTRAQIVQSFPSNLKLYSRLFEDTHGGIMKQCLHTMPA
jgi:hypothetical protein